MGVKFHWDVDLFCELSTLVFYSNPRAAKLFRYIIYSRNKFSIKCFIFNELDVVNLES